MPANPRYVVNVEAAIYRGDCWLLIRRSEQEAHAGGTLALVGGKVEDAGVADAILEETLRREIREEVGVEVEPTMHYTRSTAFVAEDGDPVVDVVFTCRHATGEPRALDPDEVAAVYWLTAAEVEAHPDAPPWTRRSIRDAEALHGRLDARS